MPDRIRVCTRWKVRLVGAVGAANLMVTVQLLARLSHCCYHEGWPRRHAGFVLCVLSVCPMDSLLGQVCRPIGHVRVPAVRLDPGQSGRMRACSCTCLHGEPCPCRCVQAELIRALMFTFKDGHADVTVLTAGIANAALIRVVKACCEHTAANGACERL